MADRIIQQADLDGITQNLGAIHGDLQVIDSNVDVRKKVKKILNNNHKLCKLFDNIFEA